MAVPSELAPYLTGVWQMAIDLAVKLLDIADDLEKRRLYRFADQLRGAGMSMSNNIAARKDMCPFRRRRIAFSAFLPERQKPKKIHQIL